MYLRAAHAEGSIALLREFIHSNPLGVITTAIKSSVYPLLQCSHIPWVLDVSDPASETELGRLRGHLARVNPHSKAMIEAASSSSTSPNDNKGGRLLEDEVMILFTSPIQHYVTPKFYIETKPATGKVVPTWNYAAVQAYGKATIHFDPNAAATVSFLSTQIDDLSRHAEVDIMGHVGQNGKPGPWSVAEAPDKYIDLLRKAIIGIEVEITRLEGKWKMSQELPPGDREGTLKGFEGLGTQVGSDVADMIRKRALLKEEREKEKARQKETSS